ncbi:hypothetical protein GCM10023258_19360 [Terrabacter aeriphilus]|uniref:Uncharacterized protein n=1 Tax=Terrabacter aeriphilus TaxID=515662 RepID=A0ABP9JD43_9MICO
MTEPMTYAGSTRQTDVDEAFLEIVLGDPDLLDAQFAEIVRADGPRATPSPTPGPPGRRRAPGAGRGSGAAPGGTRREGDSMAPRRERSPPSSRGHAPAEPGARTPDRRVRPVRGP